MPRMRGSTRPQDQRIGRWQPQGQDQGVRDVAQVESPVLFGTEGPDAEEGEILERRIISQIIPRPPTSRPRKSVSGPAISGPTIASSADRETELHACLCRGESRNADQQATG